MSSFVSEFLVLAGTFVNYPWQAIVATTGIVLAALYILIMFQRTMTGPVTKQVEGMTDLGAREKWSLVPVIAVILALGFFPQVALNVVNPAVDRTMSVVGVTDPAPVVAPVAEGAGVGSQP
jgi:NADH-quinone oxidoreductase subunit M